MASKASSNFFSTIQARSPDQALLMRPTLSFLRKLRMSIQQGQVNDVAGEKFVTDGLDLRFRQVQPAHDGSPVFVFADDARYWPGGGLALEDQFHQVFVLHAKTFRQVLARRLELGADDHATQVNKDGPDGHFFFAPAGCFWQWRPV